MDTIELISLLVLGWAVLWGISLFESSNMLTTLNQSNFDQKCPHCNTVQSSCGGWADVDKVQNKDRPFDVDFIAYCGNCKRASYWVLVEAGRYATFEEFNKIKPNNKL